MFERANYLCLSPCGDWDFECKFVSYPYGWVGFDAAGDSKSFVAVSYLVMDLVNASVKLLAPSRYQSY